MKKNFFFFAFLLTFLAFGATAQGVLKFESESHDFGKVKEGDIASYQFKFTNTGNAPIILSKVQASCGCTTPEWTKEPILPGKTGIITASYNSNARPGAFTKTVTVTSNATEGSKILTIKGMVEGKNSVKKEVTAAQKAVSPRLTITSPTTHTFGKAEKGQKLITKFQVKNTGKEDLVINNVSAPCNCVMHTIAPTSIKPGQSGTLELTYIPRSTGERIELVSIFSNDVVSPDQKVNLKASVVESLTTRSVVREGGNAVPFK